MLQMIVEPIVCWEVKKNLKDGNLDFNLDDGDSTPKARLFYKFILWIVKHPSLVEFCWFFCFPYEDLVEVPSSYFENLVKIAV